MDQQQQRQLEERILRGINRLRQFSRYYIGRVTGTTTIKNGRYQYFKNLEERMISLRAEFNAFTKLLLDKNLITLEEFNQKYAEELELAFDDFKKMYPEVSPSQSGGSFSLDQEGFKKRAKEEEWPP